MFSFEAPEDAGTAQMRATVRELLAEWHGRFTPGADSWMRGYDPAFTKAMSERGLIGITWPVQYGGGGKRNIDRLAVTEELLRAGAPVAAHWISDRQIGPAILRHGTEEQRQEFLPKIIRGESLFCLGMSEPEAGSDLAGVKTSASTEPGGWRLRGRKIWTTGAHHATHIYVLARTDDCERRHDGLSEFIVDMSAPGVSVSPIVDITGEHHFNEVLFEEVHVPDDRLLGERGNGWRQVMDQLSFERGGPERILSTYPLVPGVLESGERISAREVGAMFARLAGLRRMAFAVSGRMDAGEAPSQEAATLKLLGNEFENDLIELARSGVDAPLTAGSLVGSAVGAAPGFTIRGGAADVMLSLIARSEASR